MLLADGTIEALGLILIRTTALVLFSPVLGLGSGFSGYKIALIFGLGIAFYGMWGEPLSAEVDTIAYGAMAVREMLIGFFLSFMLNLVTLAVRVAGELIGHEMGFMMARQVDPATGIQTPIITSFYENFFVLAFLSVNGHHWLLRALGASFERAPVGDVAFGGGVALVVQRLFSEMFSAGLVFAAPVMMMLLLTSILIGLLARVAPHLNVMEIGFTLRVLLATAALYLFAPLLEPGIAGLQRTLLVWLTRALDALEV